MLLEALQNSRAKINLPKWPAFSSINQVFLFQRIYTIWFLNLPPSPHLYNFYIAPE